MLDVFGPKSHLPDELVRFLGNEDVAAIASRDLLFSNAGQLQIEQKAQASVGHVVSELPAQLAVYSAHSSHC